jgi:hypothetical protein
MSAIPYRPSWVDRLTAAIEGVPAPTWLVYLLITVPWAVVFIGVQAWQGAYRTTGFYGWHIYAAVAPFYSVMALHYLDRVAARSIRRFRSTMKGNQIEFDEACYRLTTLPAPQAMIAGILGGLFAAIQVLLSGDAETVVAFQHAASTPISVVVHDVNIVAVWVGSGVLIYHAYHQLRTIDWLYTTRAAIDPFRPEPLYALSEITSRTAVVILLAIYGWLGVGTGGSFANLPSQPLFYLTSAFWIGLGLLVFIWPLWGAHRLLEDAKDHALEGNARGYSKAVEELHRTVLQAELAEIDTWQRALAGLDLERRQLDRLPTWPWSPGALRNVLVALVLPILIWIVQYGLQQLLG